MSEATFLKSYSDPKLVPHDGPPQVAVLGRSNVGKSSLINSLARDKKLAKTSATPGRTQLINLFAFGKDFVLVDLPGYGYAKLASSKRDILKDMIVGYLEEAGPLAGAVVITDARLGPTDLDRDMLDALARADIPVIIVANKIDKLSRSERTERMRSIGAAYPNTQVLPHSAESGDGRGELLNAIRTLAQQQKKG
ncbi:ribosome biogenesis GTP-binding protein YihA/YsxC [Patescibacteria group bacterium]|jgi:GTP-binding protein|nr:ribosome biogenesis GTP-binding protein YihA/YsxC [Patescibacteria group bacterium]